MRASGCWGSGSDLVEVLRHLEITESTWHRWRRAYAGMSAADARRLKELEAENARLKKLLAEAELDKAMLKELAEGKMVTPDTPPHGRCAAPGGVRGL